MQTLIEKVENLDTTPLNLEEEYQYSSKFLEWFYANLYRSETIASYPAVLNSVSKDPGYEMMRNLCFYLINLQHSKNFDNETRARLYADMKNWTLNAIKKYSDEDVPVC